MLELITELTIKYVPAFLAVLLVLPIHEFAHAFAGVKCGDPTPKLYGRYTLNPLAHFDMLGLACFVLCGFGWAKPVPINPYNFNNYKWGSFWVSIAGVLSNYILAFIAFPLFFLTLYIPSFGLFTEILQITLSNVYSYSLFFIIFNLLPFYPLDGFRVVDVFNKRHGKLYCFLRDYGRYVLLIFFGLSIFADITNLYYLNVLGYIINIGSGVIGYPIMMFWGLIL